MIGFQIDAVNRHGDTWTVQYPLTDIVYLYKTIKKEIKRIHRNGYKIVRIKPHYK